MRFRIKAGGPAARFTFDRTPKPQPPAPPVLRAADLDNPLRALLRQSPQLGGYFEK